MMSDRVVQNRIRFLQWLVGRPFFSFFSLYKIRNWVYKRCFPMGEHCIVLERVSIQQLHYLGGEISVGDNVLIQRDVVLDYSGGLEIGSGVVISHGSYVLSHGHGLESSGHRCGRAVPARTKIGSGAWIGAKAIVLGGVSIGEGSVVGAGSIVTKDVPPNQVWAGNPAKFIRNVDKEGSLG